MLFNHSINALGSTIEVSSMSASTPQRLAIALTHCKYACYVTTKKLICIIQ